MEKLHVQYSRGVSAFVTRSFLFFVATFLIMLVTGLISVPVGHAADITVTTLDDENGTCGTGTGCSLREAIAEATSGQEIDFAVTGTIVLTNGQLSIFNELTITGPGPDLLTISGDSLSRVFNVCDARGKNESISRVIEVNIEGLTIKHGWSVTGSGVWNCSELTMTNCVVCSCAAMDVPIGKTTGRSIIENNGGGIYNTGTLTLNLCTLFDNEAEDYGGGIYHNWNLLTLEDCTLRGNICGIAGGGIASYDEAILHNCTISENTGTGTLGGGGVYNRYDMSLIDCIIRDNTTEHCGGGMYNDYDVSPGAKSRRSTVDESATVIGLWMRGCTITGNTADDNGGGIYNKLDSFLSMVDCTIAYNRASDYGGGMYNRGEAELDSCTIHADTCGMAGGGLTNYYKAILDRCTISNNTATGVVGGGGIYNTGYTAGRGGHHDVMGDEIQSNGVYELILRNCTISGNETEVSGGGILNDGSKLLLVNCTVTGNSAGLGDGDRGKMGAGPPVGWGGGIYTIGSSPKMNSSGDATELAVPWVRMKNTIVADNNASDQGPDCSGYFGLLGYNLIGDTDDCVLDETTNYGTNLYDVDPMLGPLADNGGATQTHALLPGSPAIDAGTCVCTEGEQITSDQRDEPRPMDGDYDHLALCDIGAYEAPGLPSKMHFPQLPDRKGWDVWAFPWQCELADDWLCTASGPVTDFRFWGSWLDDIEGELLGFVPLIYSDIPAGEVETYSLPGELLWPPYEVLDSLLELYFIEANPAAFVAYYTQLFSWNSSVSMSYEPYQGFFFPWPPDYEIFNHFYLHQYDLHYHGPLPFIQEEGQIYWLSILPFEDFDDNGYEWGWKTSRDQWNDGAVFTGFPTKGKSDSERLSSAQQYPWEELRDPVTGDSLDLAFVIGTGCLSEVWVDQAWLGTDPGIEVEPGKIFGFNAFATVGEALEAICPGGTVTIHDGTYPEPGLVVNKDGLTIKAGSRPVHDGMGGLYYWIQADNVTIIGLEITNSNPAIRLGPHAVGGAITGFVVRDCHFNDNVNKWAIDIVDHNGIIDAELNYWDSCTGPDHENNPKGLGETIHPETWPDIDYDPWLYPCAYGTGDTCLSHMVDDEPDEYLLGSGPGTAMDDWWAAAFYNPGGVAKVTSLSFRFLDPGLTDIYIFTAGDSLPQDGLCESNLLYTVPALLGDSLAPSQEHYFIGLGLMRWEELELDSCVTVGSKSWFIVAWQQTSQYPRIMADDTEGYGTHSWIWNAELEQWKCFPDLEYCVEVCLDYQPGCVTLDWRDITWDPLHPCVCNNYNVTAVFHNECDTDEDIFVNFHEAKWGLFFLKESPADYRCVGGMYTVPAHDTLAVECNCEYHHQEDYGDSWSRNIQISYSADANFCFDEPLGYVPRMKRRCRRTIWPESPYGGTYGPIPIPITNDEGMLMRFDVGIVDTSGPDWAFQFAGGTVAETLWLASEEVDTLWLTVTSTAALDKPLVVWVEANKCNGETGVAEIEFMPYSEPSGIQPIEVDSLRVSRMYPCVDSTSFFIEFDVANLGGESAYPIISHGMAQWGFFFPPYEEVLDTLSIGGYDTLDNVHYESDFLLWHQEGRYFSRNVVIDYRVVKHHCFPVDSLDTLYYRDCRLVVWPPHRWPWEGEVIPIPVHNEEAYTDTLELSFIPSTVPAGWTLYWSQTSMILSPGQADTAYLSIIPDGIGPPLPPDHVITVRAIKGMCDRDTGYVYLEFLPYACLCIPDYLGKVVENLPGREPELVPGDTVFVSLMLENDLDVTGVEVDLIYDARYLFPDTTWLTDRSEGMQLIEGIIAPGQYHILIDFTPPPHPVIEPSPPQNPCQDKNSEEALKIATVPFLIIDDPPAGTCSNIYQQNVVVTGLPDVDGEPKDQVCVCYDHGQVCFGGYVFPMKCDVSLDTSVTLLDLFRILRHIVRKELLEGPVGTPGTPLWSADANGDTLINILDLMKCINKSIGRYDPKLGLPVASVSVPVEMDVMAARGVEVPLGMDVEVPVSGVLYRMRYDGSLMEMGQPVLAERCEGMSLEWGVVGYELWVLVYSMARSIIEPGAGPVVRVPFEVAADASGQWEVWFEETVVFCADERIVFADPALVTMRAVNLVPREYSLSQNYPNPFNPETDIRYGLPKDSHVRLEVFNLLGQRVEVLVDERQEAGYYHVRWDAGEMASGVYFYRIQANEYTTTKRMVLMK